MHHLVHVRRVKVGDEIRLFDGEGRSYVGIIEEIATYEIKGTIKKELDSIVPKVKLNFYHAVSKGERFDWLIEKLAELGVSMVVPLITERSVVKKISESKVSRWRRISIAASKQCSRADIMAVREPALFRDASNEVVPNITSIIPWEGEATKGLNEVITEDKKEYNVFIGPEGGFTTREIERAQRSGFIPVTLGKRILRVETAGLLSTFMILNRFHEFDK